MKTIFSSLLGCSKTSAFSTGSQRTTFSPCPLWEHVHSWLYSRDTLSLRYVLWIPNLLPLSSLLSPLSHYLCVYIWAGPVALGADARAHLLYPTTSIWPRVQKCPFKNATYGILQTSKTASATLAFSTSGYAISEGNMLPCCFHRHTVVTPSVSATWVVWWNSICCHTGFRLDS